MSWILSWLIWNSKSKTCILHICYIIVPPVHPWGFGKGVAISMLVSQAGQTQSQKESLVKLNYVNWIVFAESAYVSWMMMKFDVVKSLVLVVRHPLIHIQVNQSCYGYSHFVTCLHMPSVKNPDSRNKTRNWVCPDCICDWVWPTRLIPWTLHWPHNL